MLVGMLVSVLWHVGSEALVEPLAWILAVVALPLLYLKVSPAWLVLGGTAIAIGLG